MQATKGHAPAPLRRCAWLGALGLYFKDELEGNGFRATRDLAEVKVRRQSFTVKLKLKVTWRATRFSSPGAMAQTITVSSVTLCPNSAVTSRVLYLTVVRILPGAATWVGLESVVRLPPTAAAQSKRGVASSRKTCAILFVPLSRL